MTRLYAATGDGISRLDETDNGWSVEIGGRVKQLPAGGRLELHARPAPAS